MEKIDMGRDKSGGGWVQSVLRATAGRPTEWTLLLGNASIVKPAVAVDMHYRILQTKCFVGGGVGYKCICF